MYNVMALPSLEQAWLRSNSNIPSRFLGYDFDYIEKNRGEIPFELSDWVEDVVNQKVVRRIGGLGQTGVGILLYGEPGRGKTTAAVATAAEVLLRMPESESERLAMFDLRPESYGYNFRPIYFMTMVDFLSRKKAMIEAPADEKRELYYQLEGLHGRLPRSMDEWNIRVLVIDDLGKEYGSRYDDTSFDELLRSRYDKGLPTIITTNLPPGQWAAQYGEAMGSFVHEAFYCVHMMGKDFRKS